MTISKNADKTVKKQEIIRAAIKAFAKNGVARTKMEDIATLAGIGKGTIYEYFRSKEDVFLEAYKLFCSELDKKIDAIIQGDYNPDQKLKMLVTESLTIHWGKKRNKYIGKANEFAGIILEFWSEGIRKRDDKMIKALNLKNAFRKYRKTIADVLNDGIDKGLYKEMDTRLTSSVIIAITDGIPMQWILDPKAFKPKEIIEVIIDNIIYGIKK